MTYQEALRRLYGFQTRGVRMGIERTRDALLLRGSPERGIPFIQIAGTNGKGSVASMMAAALSAAGYRTGLYTSPHLQRYVERICIDGRPISEREAATRIEGLLSVFEKPNAPDISFFELTTVLAIEAFRDRGCDIVVLEVGLGGRLDSTTAVPSIVSVITGIALDHTEWLGETTELIAREKAGIIRRRVPLVVGRCDASARRVIASRARALHSPVLWLDREYEIQNAKPSGRFDLRVEGALFQGLKVRLLGEHQLENAACAVAALYKLRREGFDIPESAIRRALSRVRWPGRLEFIPGEPNILLDSAHNPDGSQTLAAYVEKNRERWGKRVLIFGALSDKNYREMIQILAPLFTRVFFSLPKLSRAAPIDELVQACPGTPTRTLESALNKARRAAGADGLVVITGSIFLVAEARAKLLGVRTDPFIRM